MPKRVRGSVIVEYFYDEPIQYADTDGLDAAQYLEDLYANGEMGMIDNHEVKDAEFYDSAH